MTIYLYVKRHAITGLKYFGKTTRKDPYSYNGSGTYWSNHIKKYGVQYVETIDIWEFDDQDECTNFALEFSKNNNVVESKEWANQIPEDGKSSSLDYVNSSIEIIQKRGKSISKSKTGKRYGFEYSQIRKTAMQGKNSGDENPFYGKHHDQLTLTNMSDHSSNSKWYNNGVVEKFIHKDNYVPAGFFAGRIKGKTRKRKNLNNE